jgi:sulfite reductase alpha subunit-like flavoprotein
MAKVFRFNVSARKLHKRLNQLGAKEVYPRGEADEQHDEGFVISRIIFLIHRDVAWSKYTGLTAPNSIDGTFLSWSLDLRKRLLSTFPLPSGVTPIPQDVLLPPKYTLEILQGRTELLKSTVITQGSSPSPSSIQPCESPSAHPRSDESSTLAVLSHRRTDLNMAYQPPDSNMDFCPQLKEEITDHEPIHDSSLPPVDELPIEGGFRVKLLKNQRVTPESHWQDVRLLTFVTPNKNAYDPGDAIKIHPKNFPEDVQSLINLQDWNDVADLPLTLKATAPEFFLAKNLVSNPPGLFPLEESTLRQLLTHNLDITAIPNRHFFHVIANYTNDPMHKERLLEFTNPAYTDEFFDYTTRPRRSILEVLQDFPSVRVPWNFATLLFPVIRPRSFSIATGGAQRVIHEYRNAHKFQILVALVKYKTVLKKIRQGLCSRYLASLQEGTCLTVSMNINLPVYEAIADGHRCPMILVGPGTGVAPCRSIIWERAAQPARNSQHAGENVLFFGNRNQNADFFFKDEWKLPLLRLRLFAAFSRDQRKKVYVQDLIRQEGRLIKQLLDKDAFIIVCGSSGNMPKQVREAFIDVLVEHGRSSREEAEKRLEDMGKNGRYLQEVW